MDVKEVIEAIASGIATLSSKVFDEKAKEDLVETLLGTISSITKYSRQMELQVELGTEREHDAIRMMEKFKKSAKAAKDSYRRFEREGICQVESHHTHHGNPDEPHWAKDGGYGDEVRT